MRAVVMQMRLAETADEESMLQESGSYLPGQPYTAQIENTTGHLRFSKVLQQGDNFERVAFEWIN